MVNQWKTICNKEEKEESKDFVFKKQEGDNVINVTFKGQYYRKLEKGFNGLSTNKDETKESKMKSFAKNVIEQER